MSERHMPEVGSDEDGVELSDLDAISVATGGISGTTTDLNEVARVRMEGPFAEDFGGVNTHTDSAPSGG